MLWICVIQAVGPGVSCLFKVEPESLGADLGQAMAVESAGVEAAQYIPVQ